MSNTPTIDKIEALLDAEVRPSLAAHNGGVEVESLEGGILKLRFKGQCSGCPSAELTMESLISDTVKEAFPEVKEVVLVSGAGEDMLGEAWDILQARRAGREGGA